MIAAIVAVDSNWGIGYNGDLLESIPADLKHFKEITSGHTIIMGRKTWDSLPKKPLPNRTNIILSREYGITFDTDTQIGYMNLKWLYRMLENIDANKEIYVIGGGQIYKELLSLCDRIYVTKIYKEHENVDTYFPNLDAIGEWSATPIGELEKYKDFTYQFWRYDRNS